MTEIRIHGKASYSVPRGTIEWDSSVFLLLVVAIAICLALLKWTTGE